MKTIYTIELMRHGVTPAQFLAYVRSQCKKHDISIDHDYHYFTEGEKVNGEYWNTSYTGGTPSTRPAFAETVKSLPYDQQTYIRNFDGSVFNEIIEFTFDDEKTGHGYYFIISTEAEPGDDESVKQSTIKYHTYQIEQNTRKIDQNRTKIDRLNESWFDACYAESMVRMFTDEIEVLERENAEHIAAIEEVSSAPSATEPTTEDTQTTNTTDTEKEDEPMTTANTNHTTDTIFTLALTTIVTRPYATRSAWSRGVTEYATELLEGLKESVEDGYFDPDDLNAPKLVDRALLNGASDWWHYSWSGCSLIFDRQIAERLCTKSELKHTRNAERKPNAREEWLDVQGRALYQASTIVKNALSAVLMNI